MSLLDDASIVVTPNGYKQGVLFSVIPSSGAADLEVTRGTAATRVDEAGLVNYAEVIGDSILTGNNSNFDTGIGSWVTYNGATLEHSTDKLEVTLTSGQSGARINTNSLISGGQSGKTFKVRARIWQGTTTTTAFKIFIGVQENITISSTPTYFEFELTPTSTSMLTIYRAVSGDTGTYFIDDVTVKEVTRDNVPRIDYTGGGCPHILAEPQRTNIATYSEDFSQSFYIKDSGITIGTTNNVSPTGDTNATKIDVTNNDRIYANVASDTYAVSWYIKAGTFSYFTSGGNIDLVAETYSGGSIESVGNGWFRISKAYTGIRPFQIQAYPDGTYSPHTTTGDYYIWGAQLEVGSYATSYIPTSGSTVTRNQDQFTRDGISSLINSEEGVLFLEMAALSDDLTRRKITISDGTSNNFCSLYFDSISNKIIGRTTVGGVLQSFLSTSSYTEINFNKIAFKWRLNDFALWVNGTEVGVDSSGVTWGSGVLTEISLDNGVGGESFYGKVKQLQVYKTALTDTQLTSLTE